MIVDLLPPAWRPFGKAIVAALLPVIALVLLGLISGDWNLTALAGAVVGACGAIATVVAARVPTARTLLLALGALAGLVIGGAITGDFNTQALTGAGLAVLSALLVHQTPNVE